MLVLTRAKGERIKIGDAVITVVATGKNEVRIGIEAPQEIRIIRGELCGLPADPVPPRPLKERARRPGSPPPTPGSNRSERREQRRCARLGIRYVPHVRPVPAVPDSTPVAELPAGIDPSDAWRFQPMGVAHA